MRRFECKRKQYASTPFMHNSPVRKLKRNNRSYENEENYVFVTKPFIHHSLRQG